jgi:hypothetical protein
MPSDGHRVTDTIRTKFSGNQATDVPPGGGSAGGSHAVTAGSAGSNPPSTRPDTETTQVLPTTDRTGDTGDVRDSTRELRPDADRTRNVAPPAAMMSRKEVVDAQKARYGGIHWGPAFFGWLSANGLAVLLVALLSAGGVAVGLTQGVSVDEAVGSAAGIGLGGGIALLVVLFLAYLAGGYVAGRMSRFNGAKQGVAVWVIGLLVVLLLALAGLVFGSQYNVLGQLNLPRIPINEGTATTAGIIALAAVLVATLGGAVLGGILGTRYHKKVDRVGFDAVHAGR